MATSFLSFILLVGALSTANAAIGEGGISSIELDRANKTVNICLEQGTEVVTDQLFRHPDLSGYIIHLAYGPTCTPLLKESSYVSPECFIGHYRINSHGFAPHIYITLDEHIKKHRAPPKRNAPSENVTAPSKLQQLKKNDPVRQTVEEVATEWRDNNTSTGTTELTARILVTQDEIDFKTLSENVFRLRFKENTGQALPAATTLVTTGGRLTAARLKKLVLSLAEGTAYNTRNPENLNVFNEPLKTLIPLLGPNENTMIYMTEARLENDSDPGELRNVSTGIIINTETNKLLILFVIEGTK